MDPERAASAARDALVLGLLKAPRRLSSHPVDVGQRSEAAILATLVRRGYSVLVPFGVNHRYDLVLDLPNKFVRAQCKTGRLVDGCITFSTKSIRSNRRGVFSKDYVGDADVFLIHCPEVEDSLYVVPVEAAPRHAMRLRVHPVSNGQSQGIHWARDYELPG
jgi:PD-(D/E)XK endonuclease